MKKILIVSMIIVLAVGCAPATEPASLPADTTVTSPPATDSTSQPSDTQTAMPFSPLPNDANLQRGNVFITEADLLIRESYPVQIALVLSGELSTPCHQLRVNVNLPDAESKIHIEAYTVYNPELMCIQVVKPFQENIELGTFPSGHYTVWVNDAQVGEFDS